MVRALVIAPDASQVVIIGRLAVSVLLVAILPLESILPLASISKLVVTTPVTSAIEICSKPFSERIGPLKVELAIWLTSLLKVSL
jgi:hypothetical protein